MQLLSAYVPTCVQHRIAADPRPLQAPEFYQGRGSLLFLDISGFTALTELLAHDPREGTEKLTRVLNTYFDRLITTISEHGGDVVSLAGDAITALWEADRDYGVAGATVRATVCGLAARKAIGTEAIAREHGLSLRGAISTGDVGMMFLGGVSDRWEIVLVGEAVRQIATASRNAQSDQLIASAEAREFLDGRCEYDHLPGGFGAIRSCSRPIKRLERTPPALSDDAHNSLLTFVPGAVRARLLAGQSGWLAELRRVSVIFVQLPEWDQSGSSTLNRNHAVMRSLQSVLYQFEGSINKLSVDDKGITLLAVMGLPPFAHEDDAVRAVRCGQLLQAKLRQFNVRCAVGIATGRVFCGSLGTEQRREYTVIGQVVNLAARLMQSAPGDILCDEATYHAAATRVRFERLAPLALKGSSAPVVVFRPYSEAAQHPERSTLVGRATEQRALMEHLRNVLDGTSSVLLVEGEAGIGKSRLIRELQSEANARSVRTLVAMGDSIERTTAYHAWRPVFIELLGLENFPDPESRRDVLAAAAADDPELHRLLPLLSPVVSLDLRDNEFTAQMSGQARADQTNALLLHILAQEARRGPLLIIFDDAHWADSASVVFTSTVARELKPVFLVIASRPSVEPLSSEHNRLFASVTDRFRLAPLHSQDATRLVAQRLGVAELPEPIADLIRAKAQGNPFFSEELAFALRDAGVISVRGTRCEISAGVDLTAVSLPDSVEGVVTHRMDRLPAAHQLTLKVASVIGRVFAFRILRDIHPIEPERDRLIDHLETFRRLDLATPEVLEPDLAYAFKHAITQEVAYNLMLYSQRRQLHRAIAEWYESRGAEGATEASLLAHHWRGAGDHERALDWLERAAADALRTGAYAEALSFGETASKLLSTSEDEATLARRVRIERGLAEASYGLGRHDATRDHCDRLLTLLKRKSASDSDSFAFPVAREVLTQVYRRISSRTQTLQSERENALHASRAFEMLSFVRFFANNELGTVQATLAALNEAERTCASAELARNYANVGYMAGLQSAHRLAQYYFDRALDTAHQTANKAATAWVQLVYAMYKAGVGDWDTARRYLEEASGIQEEIGDRRRWVETACFLSTVNHFEGRFAERLGIANRVSKVAAQTGDVQARAWGLLDEIEGLLPAGEHVRAGSLLQELSPLLELKGATSDLIWFGGLRARYELDTGSITEAAETALRTLERMQGNTPTALYTLEGYAGTAEVLLQRARHEPNRYSAAAQQAVVQLKRFAARFPIAQPRTQRLAAQHAWVTSKRALAAKRWKRARALAVSYRMPYEVSLCDLDVACYLLESEPRTSALERARAAFRQVQAVRECVLIDGLLEN